jgi:hypothetical protein
VTGAMSLRLVSLVMALVGAAVGIASALSDEALTGSYVLFVLSALWMIVAELTDKGKAPVSAWEMGN